MWDPGRNGHPNPESSEWYSQKDDAVKSGEWNLGNLDLVTAPTMCVIYFFIQRRIRMGVIFKFYYFKILSLRTENKNLVNASKMEIVLTIVF